MKRAIKGFILVCREVTWISNSNETHVEEEGYVDNIMAFFDHKSDALEYARIIIGIDSQGAKLLEWKVKDIDVTDEQITDAAFDGTGNRKEDGLVDFYPYIQWKTKPENNKKKIIERSMYIVDCNRYSKGAFKA